MNDKIIKVNKMSWKEILKNKKPEYLDFDKEGDTEEHKFLCTLDSVSDASEMNQDGERFIKSTFNVVTKAYLLPEETNSIVMGKMNQVQKRLSPSKVIFGYEGDATNNQVKK